MSQCKSSREVSLQNSLPKKLWFKARYLIPLLLIFIFLTTTEKELALNVLSDAFFQVGVFVLATLCIYHFAASALNKLDLPVIKKVSEFKIIFAALLGMLPGCGGAIIVITQFIKGQYSFGAVVAVLTATMGDAAFLLMATMPADSISVMLISLTVGCLSGYITDGIFGKNFLRPNTDNIAVKKSCPISTSKLAVALWKLMLVPAIIISGLMAFQQDPNEWLNLPRGSVELFGGVFAILAILMWAIESSSADNQFQDLVAEHEKSSTSTWFAQAVQDTNFVLSWAVMAFLVFELINYWADLDLTEWFGQWSMFAPLIGVLIGLIPGCGPQIVVTSLYINGAVPFSAQLGNAISNDGDALFPAIALAPKVALYATLCSTVPALIVAYSYYWLFE
ncbi:putative manganese transporter [Catenovulum sp. 2E275]|uniref:putative manganese transporter n=1 Tax=Catenovulum sp. 2E275 TaxID=2980497 RepID=UPI0021D34332|nr:putative manganese transporter [Catenovulum sp. 2E275]MCU4675225.1 putative manganese transporter [Catenovulum sp. 2E275]